MPQQTMTRQHKILVVDDTPLNLKFLADLLEAKGFAVTTSSSGAESLDRIDREPPDLVLLDVLMPGMTGYDVCRTIRQNSARYLPVIMVTALDPAQERVRGLEAGADDFLPTPINQAELLARVRSLIRIKDLYDTVQAQAAQLSEWNKTLEQRVQDQVSQLQRLGRLKHFFSPQLADLLLSGEGEDALASHRRDITVVFLDLRGFTAFAETAEPEEVMEVLRTYHAEIGRLISQHQGTLEHFAGDGVMVFFNDPVPVPNPAMQAVRMAVEVKERLATLIVGWSKKGIELGFGAGIASGYATLGVIGFEGRWDYAAIGTVTNLAARLCGEAVAGQILVSQRIHAAVEHVVDSEPIGTLNLKGFHRSVSAYNVKNLKG